MADKQDEDKQPDPPWMNHLIYELPATNASISVKTVVEHRGVRSLSREVFKDPGLTLARLSMQLNAADTYASLVEAADHLLRKHRGITSSPNVVAGNNAKGKIADQQECEIDDFSYLKWAAHIGERTGYLSPAAMAANFVKANALLHRRIGNDAELCKAVYAFADAWHWFHFEARGEHEIAASGLRSLNGRARGPAAKKQIAAERLLIIKTHYDNFVADPLNKKAAASAKPAAGKLLSGINASLEKAGIAQVKEPSLRKMLSPLIKAASSKGDSA